MPSIGLRAVLLEDIRAHHCDLLHLRLRRRALDVMSDLSSDSDSFSGTSSDSDNSDISDMSMLSPDSPDSDVVMLSDSSRSASSSDSDLSEADSDFEEAYYLSYERRYRALLHEIETTRVLEPGPSVPKLSQLPLLDHFREFSIERWRHYMHAKRSGDTGLFDSIWEKQIRIRVEHCIGLLKGRFQSLFQLRIQVYDHKRHLWAIMWIRCCIILHNLIIRLESGAINEEWRQEMYNEWYAREGEQLRRRQLQDDSDDSDGDGSDGDADLRQAQHAAMTDGEHFRRKVMNALFDNPSSGAVRRT
ncbi:hypothetical protein DFH07DRAFT_784286 [Mycena maculata]|uniref:DDE Tnp4 domain-containing protein n=1 Tax=Mycena maculata TaxID=230809 RepID=A0AAD7HHJ9_9AGAR|nr:hypothetical protein DFH07DRAFT_784286 [Mycena maculata]